MPREPKLHRMTEGQFETVLPLLKRWSPDAVKIAKSILVDGVSRREAAEQAGVSLTRVGTICVNVAELLPEDLPDGWERVEVWLPPVQARKVREVASKALETARSAPPSTPPKSRRRKAADAQDKQS